MIGNVFENGTGTCLAFGKAGSPQIAFFTDKGHIFVEGKTNGNVYPTYLKYEAGQVVPDRDRVQAYEAREQGKVDRRQAAITAFQELRDQDATAIDWTNPNQVRMAWDYMRDRVIIMMRYAASRLDA